MLDELEPGGGGLRNTLVESSLPLVFEEVEVDEDIPEVEDGISAFMGPLFSNNLGADLNLLDGSWSCFGGSASPNSAIRDKYSSSILALLPPPPEPGGPPSPGRLALK